MSVRNSASSKVLGDAGEHYALSQLSFAGNFAAKMPDNWEAYDLAVESGSGLLRVSVKTRNETTGWAKSKWFTFDDRKPCDWFVFVFRYKSGRLRAWAIPHDVALACANEPGPTRKEPWAREISWSKLGTTPLSHYEDNWSLSRSPTRDQGAESSAEHAGA